MITWLLVKSLAGKLVANWRIVIIVVLVAYALYETHAHNVAVTKLAELEASVKRATDKQVAEQAISYATATVHVDKAVSMAALDFEHFDLNRASATKAIKDLYEKPHGNVIPIKFDSMRLAASGSEQTSQIVADTEGLARSKQECDAALTQSRQDNQTLVDACRITTIDFNTCRSVLDADTLMYGREVF